MKRNKKLPDYDDGRTIAEMNVDGMPWYNPKADKRSKNDEDKPTRKELRAMVRAGYLAYLPRVLATLLGFGVCVFLAYLWLNGWTL